MLIPVKCFTCGKCIGGFHQEFEKLQREILESHTGVFTVYTDEDIKKNLAFFESKNLSRYCCRRMLTSYTNVFDDLITSKDE